MKEYRYYVLSKYLPHHRETIMSLTADSFWELNCNQCMILRAKRANFLYGKCLKVNTFKSVVITIYSQKRGDSNLNPLLERTYPQVCADNTYIHVLFLIILVNDFYIIHHISIYQRVHMVRTGSCPRTTPDIHWYTHVHSYLKKRTWNWSLCGYLAESALSPSLSWISFTNYWRVSIYPQILYKSQIKMDADENIIFNFLIRKTRCAFN